jgi:hypothetical protein
MLLLCSGTKKAAAVEYTDNVEVGEADIRVDRNERPPIFYLIMEFKNNGDKKVSNLNFEISYYAKEGYLIKKVLMKNALTEEIPQRESRKYKIRLRNDFFDDKNEQYPYSRKNEVAEFDIKITNVKLASK